MHKSENEMRCEFDRRVFALRRQLMHIDDLRRVIQQVIALGKNSARKSFSTAATSTSGSERSEEKGWLQNADISSVLFSEL